MNVEQFFRDILDYIDDYESRLDNPQIVAMRIAEIFKRNGGTIEQPWYRWACLCIQIKLERQELQGIMQFCSLMAKRVDGAS